MKKAEIGQPQKAGKEYRVTIVFEKCAFKPRVVQAEIVNTPEVFMSHWPATKIEVNDA
jgi:hypothetical protein